MEPVTRFSQNHGSVVIHGVVRGVVRGAITEHKISVPEALNVPYEGTNSPANAATRAAFPSGFSPAFGSGLALKGLLADGSVELFCVTDRGPNGEGPSVQAAGMTGSRPSKVFPAPNFAPCLGIMRLGEQGAVITERLPLRWSEQQLASGLPPPGGAEVPLNERLQSEPQFAQLQAHGVDPEGIAFDASTQRLWVSDEYGPRILAVNVATGVIETVFSPGAGLPSVLALHRANRGLECLTFDSASGCLHAALQSVIDPRDAAGQSLRATAPDCREVKLRDAAAFIRWLVLLPTRDEKAPRSQLFAYPVDERMYAKGRSGHAKLGDIASLGDGSFVAIEQGETPLGMQHWLMRVDFPTNATDIAAMDHALEVSSITEQPEGDADFSQVVPLRKTMLLDLTALGWTAEKCEGITLIDPHTLAISSDNDFAVRTELVDAAGAVLQGSIEDCTVNESGALIHAEPSAAAGSRLVSAALGAGYVWRIRFERALTDYPR
jgi:hypothetical protein